MDEGPGVIAPAPPFSAAERLAMTAMLHAASPRLVAALSKAEIREGLAFNNVPDAPILTYAPDHYSGVSALWQIVFPDDPTWNAAAVAIPAKLAVQPELFLVAVDGEAIIGTIMAGYDGHRGWLYALAVHPDHRRRGAARRLVEEAVSRLRVLGCGKVNLQVRAGNEPAAAFWRSMGFDVEERVSMGRRV